MPVTPIDVEAINDLLDGYRERHSITSDEKLAQALGVSHQAIYRWRRGEIDRAARILVAVDRAISQVSEYSTAA